MRELILQTKLMRPRLSDQIISRKRLLELIKSNSHKKIMVICADAGYGKTTMLSQLINNLNLDHVWYQIDESDLDFFLFMRYLVEGVRRCFPDFGSRTVSVIDNIEKRGEIIEIAMGTFINELVALTSDRLWFILDDFHNIGGPNRITAGLNYFLDHLPPNVTVIISTRKTPVLSLDGFYIKGEILEIGRDDLRFDDAEIAMLYEQLTGDTPNQKLLERLKADSEGWITYLQFLIQPVCFVERAMRTKASLPARLHAYFDKEIFTPLVGRIKDFLLATSVFEYLSPEACDFLRAGHDSQELLRELKRRHLFIGEYHEKQTLYRLHHLFRNFLIEKLQEHNNMYRRYHERAGLYWKGKGVFSETIRHYLEAKKFEAVSGLIKRYGDDYLGAGNVEFMKNCIGRLPKAIINGSPALIRILGRIDVFECRWDRAAAFFKKAKKLAITHKDYDEFFQAMHNQFVMEIDLGRYKGIVNGLKMVLRSKKLRKSGFRMRFLSSLGAVYSFEGKTKQAISVYSEALELARRFKEDSHVNTLMNNLGVLNLDIGDFEEAQQFFETLRKKLKNEATPLLMPVLNNLSNVHTRKGNLAEAEAIAREAQTYARLFNDRRRLCANIYNLGIIKLNNGDLKEAARLLHEAERLSSEIGFKAVLSSIWRGMAELLHRQGDFCEARKYIDKALSVPLPVLYKVPFLITEAEIALSLKEYDTAEDALHEAVAKAKEWKHQLMKLHVLLGQLYLRKNNKAKALEYVSKAFTAAKKYSYDYLLLQGIRFFPEVIRFVEEMRIEPDYFRHLLSQCPYPEIVETIIEPRLTDYDFVVRLMGKVQIFVNGEFYRGPWRAKRFKELFCFLVVYRTATMTRDKITCALWPDHAVTTARQLFHNALNWLRKNFGKDIIVFDADGYSLSPRHRYWVDIEELSRFIKEGDASVSKGNLIKGLRSYERAIRLYRGGFMDDFYTEWCQEKRQYYNALYIDTVKKIISNYYEIGNFKKALEYYELSITRHAYDEEVFCSAMRCYAALNDTKGLKSCFSRLKDMLAKDFKTTPHTATLKLFHTLIGECKSS